MEIRPRRVESTDEQMPNIWSASRKYVEGIIEVDKYEEVEDRSSRYFRLTNLAPTENVYASKILFGSLATLCIVVILITFVVFLYTQDQLLIGLSALASYPLFMRLEYYFERKGDDQD